MRLCLKQLTRCVVVLEDGRTYTATNLCDVHSVNVCPRVTAGCPTGEGYELCGSTHAEANVAALLPDEHTGGTAYLYGHNWLCGPCQWALQEKGISRFVVTGDAA